MRRIWRLLLYVRPYALYSLASVVLMAIVGAMAAFRILLVKPIFDNVLSPDAPPGLVLVFRIPHTDHIINLQRFLPSHFHNAWTVVAVALVGSALLKSVCDYSGTYLVNRAGFGMITDLRNDLYDAVLRRSVAFFQKHTTGTLLSTLINDIEKVQFAMSTVLSDFLQQFFTLVFTVAAVVIVGGQLAWILLLFLPVVVLGLAHWARSAAYDAEGSGQARGDPEYPARDDYGQSHCEGVRHGTLGDGPLSPRGTKAVRCESQVGEGAGDQFAANGSDCFSRDRIGAVFRSVEHPAQADDRWIVYHLPDCCVYVVRPGA